MASTIGGSETPQPSEKPLTLISLDEFGYPETEGPVAMLLRVCRRHWRVIAAVTLAAAVAAVIFTLLKPRTYTAVAAVVSQNADATGSSLSSFAAQFGVPVGTKGAQSPAFYAYVLKSPDILASAGMADYEVRDGRTVRRGNILEVSGINSGPPDQRLQRVAAFLSAYVKTSFALETGVVTLNVTTPSPTLSASVAENLLAALQKFNRENRQTSARVEREFVEQRMANSSSDLRAAEQRLQQFRESNRDIGPGSPRAVELDRLSRDVAIQTQTYTALALAYERAKIDEIRDNPTVSILQRPRIPLSPDSRGGTRRVLLWSFAAFAAALAFAALRDRRLQKESSSPA